MSQQEQVDSKQNDPLKIVAKDIFKTRKQSTVTQLEDEQQIKEEVKVNLKISNIFNKVNTNDIQQSIVGESSRLMVNVDIMDSGESEVLKELDSVQEEIQNTLDPTHQEEQNRQDEMLKSPLFQIPKHSIIIIAQKEDSPGPSVPNIFTKNTSPHKIAKKNPTPFQKYVQNQHANYGHYGPKKQVNNGFTMQIRQRQNTQHKLERIKSNVYQMQNQRSNVSNDFNILIEGKQTQQNIKHIRARSQQFDRPKIGAKKDEQDIKQSDYMSSQKNRNTSNSPERHHEMQSKIHDPTCTKSQVSDSAVPKASLLLTNSYKQGSPDGLESKGARKVNQDLGLYGQKTTDLLMSATNSSNQNNDKGSIPYSKPNISQSFHDVPYHATGLNKNSFDSMRANQNTATPGLRSQVDSETLRKKTLKSQGQMHRKVPGIRHLPIGDSFGLRDPPIDDTTLRHDVPNTQTGASVMSKHTVFSRYKNDASPEHSPQAQPKIIQRQSSSSKQIQKKALHQKSRSYIEMFEIAREEQMDDNKLRTGNKEHQDSIQSTKTTGKRHGFEPTNDSFGLENILRQPNNQQDSLAPSSAYFDKQPFRGFGIKRQSVPNGRLSTSRQMNREDKKLLMDTENILRLNEERARQKKQMIQKLGGNHSASQLKIQQAIEPKGVTNGFQLRETQIIPDVNAQVSQKDRYKQRLETNQMEREASRKKNMGLTFHPSTSKKSSYLLKKDVYGRDNWTLNQSATYHHSTRLTSVDAQIQDKYKPRERKLQMTPSYDCNSYRENSNQPLSTSGDQNLNNQMMDYQEEDPYKSTIESLPYRIQYSTDRIRLSSHNKYYSQVVSQQNQSQLSNPQLSGLKDLQRETLFLQNGPKSSHQRVQHSHQKIQQNTQAQKNMISYIMSDQTTHIEEMINLNQPSVDSVVVPKPAGKKKSKEAEVKPKKKYAFELENTSTEDACLKSQLQYKTDKKKALFELYKILDKGIEQKPILMRAQVIIDAVMEDQIDIDEALKDYDEFQKGRVFQYSQTDQNQRNKEDNIKKKLYAKMLEDMKKAKKAQPKKNFMAQFFQDKADEEKLQNIKKATLLLEKKEKVEYQPTFDQMVSMGEQYLALKQFQRGMKRAEVPKIKQQDTIRKLDQEQQRRIKIAMRRWMRSHSRFSKDNNVEKATPLLSRSSSVAQVTQTDQPFTMERARDPLNIFFKEDAQQDIQKEKGIFESQFCQVVQPNQSLDRNAKFVAGKFVANMVEKIADQQFNYSKEFQATKIRNEELLKQQKLEEELKERKKTFDKVGLDMDRVNKMMNENAFYRQEERAQIKKDEELAALELEKQRSKSKKKLGLKGMVKKNTIKISTISTFNKIHEKYKLHYEQMAARILESVEVPIYMDKNEKMKNQKKSKSFEENARERFSRASKQLQRQISLLDAKDIESESDSSQSEYPQDDGKNTPGDPNFLRQGSIRIVGAKRQNVQATDLDDLKIASIKAKEMEAEMNSLEFTSGFMLKELGKIKDQKKEILKKFIEEKKIRRATLNQHENVQSKSNNEKVQELYRDKVVEDYIYQLLKKGENVFDYVQDLSHLCNTNDSKDTAEENAGKKPQARSKPKKILSKEQVVIKHEQQCLKEGLVPLTVIFSSIQDNVLNISNYTLARQSISMQDILIQSARNHNHAYLIKVLNLHNCNLKDEGFASILNGVVKQDFVESIAYSKDEFGPKSVEVLNRLSKLESTQKTTKAISELYFTCLQAKDSVKQKLLEIIRSFTSLRKIKVAGINLSYEKVFVELCLMVNECSYLAQVNLLDLHNCFLKSKQVVKISDCLVENRNLSNLNLSNNFLDDNEREEEVITEGKKLVKKEKIKTNDEKKFVDNIIKFMVENNNLIHLNLSKMNLGKSLQRLKKQGIEKSTSLFAIHLSDNNFSKEADFEYHQLTDLHTNIDSVSIMKSQKSIIEIEQLRQVQSKAKSSKESDLIISGKKDIVKTMSDIRQTHRDRCHFIHHSSVGKHDESVEDNLVFLVNQQLGKKLNKEIQQNEITVFDDVFQANLINDEKIFTRKLGLHDLILNRQEKNLWYPGLNSSFFSKSQSQAWQNEIRDKDCFVCNKSMHVILFFNRNNLDEDFVRVENKATKDMLYQYYDLKQYRENNDSSPLILGSLTEWQPFKMCQAIVYTILRILKQFEKMTTQQSAESVQRVKEQMLRHLNQLNKHPGGNIKESLNLFEEIRSSLAGWSAYLYDQIENIYQNGEGQIFNFPYMHLDHESTNFQYFCKLLELTQGEEKSCNEKKSSSDSEEKIDSDDEIMNHSSEHPNDQFNTLFDFETSGNNNIFVYSDFVKPGVHTVLVYDPKEDQIYYKQIAVKMRKIEHQSPLVLLSAANQAKNYLLAAQEAECSMCRQIFNAFKVDNQALIKLAFIRDTDPKLCRPYKFLRKQEDIDLCLMALLQNFKSIKDSFLVMSAQSGNYPNIDEDYFTQFCKKTEIIDQDFSQKDLQVIFVEVNEELEADTQDQNPDDLLNRKEFLEIFMRIAVKKQENMLVRLKEELITEQIKDDDPDKQQEYRELLRNTVKIEEDAVPSVVEYLKHFIDDCVLPVGDALSLRNFRLSKVHQDIQVCNVLLKNQNNLKRLYSNFQQKPRMDQNAGNTFTIQSGINMLRLALIGEKRITDNQIIVEFAISKMTVIDEMLNRQEYFEMQFVEFQEFICRLANFLFKDLLHSDKNHKSEGINNSQSIFGLVEKLLEELLATIDVKLISLLGDVNDEQM